MTTRVRDQLESFAQTFAQAWNAHDAAVLCSLYAADADFVDVSGAMLHGRDAIAARHHRWFETIFAASRLTITTVKVRLVTRCAAAVHGLWSMRGHGNQDGEWLPIRTGLILFVVTKQNGTWHVVLSQASTLPPVTPL